MNNEKIVKVFLNYTESSDPRNSNSMFKKIYYCLCSDQNIKIGGKKTAITIFQFMSLFKMFISHKILKISKLKIEAILLSKVLKGEE